MAHFVYAIVAANEVADLVLFDWPELIRFAAGESHAIFPIEREQIDLRLNSGDDPIEPSETFLYLTDKFKRELLELSKHGKICYLETEYFGGEGGQGACVFEHNNELMAPSWAESDTINEALKILGVEPTGSHDAFDAIGLGDVRKNSNFTHCQDDG